MNTDFSAAISMRGFARLFGAGRFFTNTTPEGAPKLGPESRGCNAWSAVAGGVAARDLEQSPAMMTLPMDAGAEKCPATLRNPACVRPVHGMANKVEVLGLAARRKGHGTAGGRLWKLA